MDEEKKPIVEPEDKENKQPENEPATLTAEELREIRDRIDKFFATIDKGKHEEKGETVKKEITQSELEKRKQEELEAENDFDNYCYNHFDKRRK